MNANQRWLSVADDGRGKEIGPWGVIVNVGICPGAAIDSPHRPRYHEWMPSQAIPVVLGEGCAGLR